MIKDVEAPRHFPEALPRQGVMQSQHLASGSFAKSFLNTTPKISSGMSRPATAVGSRVQWTYVAGVSTYHALAALALFSWFFSWTGLCLAVAGLYVFGTLGINLCFHRLLTHRSFACPKWLEHGLSILGVCCLQDPPARWVIAHRMHHQHSDNQPDPHSPLVNFLWGHMGWLFVENEATKSVGACDRYARDILHDPFYMRLERNMLWLWINVIQAALYFLAGLGFALLTGGLAGGPAIRGKPAGVGRLRAHRRRVAHHLERQFPDAPVRLSKL